MSDAKTLRLLLTLGALLTAGCPLFSSGPAGQTMVVSALPTQARFPAEITPTPFQPATATPTPTPTLIPSPSPTPYGCLLPRDDYTRVTTEEGFPLSRRTLLMLEYAQALYGGSHDLVRAITQGSYSPGETASFGTHDGGGAVDLSVRELGNWSHVLYEDLDAILLALRQAGFAAWLRQPDELYPGSPIHIHAIAIGDAELSLAAQRQLTGPEGYFRGFNGIPADPPIPDGFGGPYLCPWMIEMGYDGLMTTRP
ncbi:MAG: hypothetical protein MUO38_07060 [Anaerolineales bacterium]|nr:hypothetical protein [Anaerolineales bacterium]